MSFERALMAVGVVRWDPPSKARLPVNISCSTSPGRRPAQRSKTADLRGPRGRARRTERDTGRRLGRGGSTSFRWRASVEACSPFNSVQLGRLQNLLLVLGFLMRHLRGIMSFAGMFVSGCRVFLARFMITFPMMLGCRPMGLRGIIMVLGGFVMCVF